MYANKPIYAEFCDFILQELQSFGPLSPEQAFEKLAMKLTKVGFPKHGENAEDKVASDLQVKINEVIAEQKNKSTSSTRCLLVVVVIVQRFPG